MRPTIASVADLLYQVKCACQQQVGWVAVRGELSGCRQARSGHLYFRLKDERSAIDGVIFRPAKEDLHFVPEDGMEVICWGECTLFAPQGRLQIAVELMEQVGRGTVAYALAQRKARLGAEGLFDPARKRPLPAFPRRIALITSPTGAALQDLLHVLRRRSPSCSLLLAGCQVQGEGAADAMADMLARVNRLHRRGVRRIDLIILGRGGGTVEDLWPFNEERLARAIAASDIPVLTGIGHETDTSIADWVADARAPTPSAAAEVAVPEEALMRQQLHEARQRLSREILRELRQQRWTLQLLQQRLQPPKEQLRALQTTLEHHQQQMLDGLHGQLSQARQRLRRLEERLRAQDPRAILARYRMRLALLRQALPQHISRHQERAARQLATCAAQLEALSPLRVLQRGYALAYDGQRQLLRDAHAVTPGDPIEIQLHNGQISARVVAVQVDEE